MSATYGISQVLRQGTSPGATNAQKRRALQVAVNEVVGRTFFGSMLKMARNSAIKSDIGHGGRGEEIFRAQLDQELVTRISQSSQVGFLDAMYKRLAQSYPVARKPASDAGDAAGHDAVLAVPRTEKAETETKDVSEEITRA